MKKIFLLILLTLVPDAFAQTLIDQTEAKQFANATFTGEVGLKKNRIMGKGRYCNLAKKVALPRSIPLIIEGGADGENEYLSYGTVNGIPGIGFFHPQYKGKPVAVSYVSGPSLEGIMPTGRQKVACGIASNNSYIKKVDNSTTDVEYTEYVGCREANRGRRPGNIYTCFQRDYVGRLARTPR